MATPETVTKRCAVCGRFRAYHDDDQFCIVCGHDGLEAQCTCGRDFGYEVFQQPGPIHGPSCRRAFMAKKRNCTQRRNRRQAGILGEKPRPTRKPSVPSRSQKPSQRRRQRSPGVASRHSTRRRTARTIRRGWRRRGRTTCCSARTSPWPADAPGAAARAGDRRDGDAALHQDGQPVGRACVDDECRAFRRARRDGRAATMAHDSYLINLASPDPVLRARSIDVVRRASCGAARRSGWTTSCRIRATSWTSARPASRATPTRSPRRWSAVPGTTILCLETTAGSGTALGATFEELAAIIDARRSGACATAWASASTPATCIRRATIS